MKRALSVLATVVLITMAVTGLFVMQFFHYLDTPVGGDAVVTVTVERGTTLKPLLDDLGTRGVLAKPRWLYYTARFRKTTDIKTGEYDVKANQTPRDILAMFLEGRVKLESFTLAEGLNRWQVRDLLAENRWMSAATFDALCDDSEFLKVHALPGPSCEGYLFPDTYTFARGVEPRKIFAKLFETFHKVFDATNNKGEPPLELSPLARVTLASIIEKETGAPEERPEIACVFYNRLKAHPAWKLQTDPTVIYAATLADPTFDGNLKAYHLREMDHPYNTYRRFGLPPGPIANPGRAALEAVVKPAACDAYFFVSMNNGHHRFCKTLDCHNQAVSQFQKSGTPSTP